MSSMQQWDLAYKQICRANGDCVAGLDVAAEHFKWDTEIGVLLKRRKVAVSCFKSAQIHLEVVWTVISPQWPRVC